jgi:hypothetical protein
MNHWPITDPRSRRRQEADVRTQNAECGMRNRIASSRRRSGWSNAVPATPQHPPHPGPLPPLGRAERENVSVSDDSTCPILRFSPAPHGPSHPGLWSHRMPDCHPLSPGERARVRAGQPSRETAAHNFPTLVTQVANLLFRRLAVGWAKAPATPADYQSATQQTASLRYRPIFPLSHLLSPLVKSP